MVTKQNSLNFRIWDKALNKWAEDYCAGTHAMTETYISLSGDIVKFSAGFPEPDEQPLYSKDADDYFHNGKFHRTEDRYVVQRGIGLNDIKGEEMFEGDIIIEYPESRQIEKIEEQISVIRDDLPRKPLRDVIIRRGKIEYCAPSFSLVYDKPTELNSVAGSLFYGNNYEIVGNIFENNL